MKVYIGIFDGAENNVNQNYAILKLFTKPLYA